MTSTQPSPRGRLSVIVNNYNYAQFVGEAIESALNLDWDDVEVIVVDDGSTDDSRSVIESYGEKITAIFQENGGQSAAVNAGFASSSGDVTILLDSDDLLVPDLAQRVMPLFADRPDVVRVQWPLRVIDAAGRSRGDRMPPEPYTLPAGDLSRHAAKFRTYLWNPTSASAYRADALRKLLPIPVERYQKGTGHPNLYLSETVVFLGEVAVLHEVGGLYRVHGANNSLNRRDDLGAYARGKIQEMQVGHENVLAVIARVGSPVSVPVDVRGPLDWAFISYRLASLAAAPDLHPMPGDRRIPLAARGAWSIARHPMYPLSARVKHIVWFAAVAVAPPKLRRKLLERVVLGAH